MRKNSISLSVLSARCGALCDDLWENADYYRLERTTLPCGARVLDAGVNAPGSYLAGARLAELCQGALAKADISMGRLGNVSLPAITCESFSPALSAYALQSATGFRGALLSGPIKLLLGEVPYVQHDIPLAEARGVYAAMAQMDALPDDAFALALAQKAGCAPEALVLAVAPQQSVAGATQICGRMNEDVLLTMDKALQADPDMVESIVGYCPVCPIATGGPGKKTLLPDDFLHYAASAHLVVRAPEGFDAAELCFALCYESLGMGGVLFADLLEAAGGDFFKIPNISAINKLACITVNDLAARRVYRAGEEAPHILLDNLF